LNDILAGLYQASGDAESKANLGWAGLLGTIKSQLGSEQAFQACSTSPIIRPAAQSQWAMRTVS
jgi:hypothetical protein